MNKEFAYADGSEEELLTIVSQADFSEDVTWQKYQKKWSLFYHLTPLRKNLLRWLPMPPGSRVLELGAGCGAITSLFAQNPNIVELVALEGAPHRAEIIKKRCQQFGSKVSVVTGSIADYHPSQQFDVVTLIGVLEYAGRYGNEADPFAACLERAARFLKPNGTLIVAIENRVGHKYQAGMNEDHYKQPFEGINNYPHYNGIKTFDKKTLSAMLSTAGLSQQSWWYPSPDYKTPTTIVSDTAFTTPDFDWLTLLDLPTKDYVWGKQPSFNERAFLQQHFDANGYGELMNSFLVFASAQPLTLVDSSVLAATMRTNTAEAFSHTTVFKKDADRIVVTRNGVQQEYHKGYHSLLDSAVDAIVTHNYPAAAISLNRWINELEKRSKDKTPDFVAYFKKRTEASLYTREEKYCESNTIDLILQNCLCNKDGNLQVIDLEWDFGMPVPQQLVIDRGMLYLLKRLNQFTGQSVLVSGRWYLPAALLAALPSCALRPDIASLFTFEYWLQKKLLVGDTEFVLTATDKAVLRSTIRATRYPRLVHIAQMPKKIVRRLKTVWRIITNK